MNVTSASFQVKDGTCGLTFGQDVKCHRLSVTIDNSKGKTDYEPAGGWTGVEAGGAGYDGSASGAPSLISAGGQGSFTVEIAKANSLIVTLYHHKGQGDGLQAQVPNYPV